VNSEEDKELSRLWAKCSETASDRQFDKEAIASMLEEGIAQPFRKMRIGLFSVLFCCLWSCVWIIYIGVQHLNDWPCLLAFAVLIAGGFYALRRQMQALKRLRQFNSKPSETVLESLHTSVTKIDEARRLKTSSIFLVLLFCISAAILNNTYFNSLPEFSSTGGLTIGRFGGIALSTVIGITVAIGLIRWRRKRFYIEPMEHIRQTIQEIENE
jgi:hypothetical protein